MPINQPENQSKKYESLFADIADGRLKIPQFQRDFVWDKKRSAKLLDSLIKGFPIGTFILWKTRERLRHVRNLGNVDLPEPPKGDAVSYVLDGQQRITSLFAVRKGAILTLEGKETDYRDICINLDLPQETDDEVVFTDHPEDSKDTFLSVHRLLTEKMAELFKSFPEHFEVIEYYKSRLTTYDFSTIVIDDYPIDIACEVFTRINTGGKSLSLFEIMVAKTYDHDSGFDLSLEYRELISAQAEDGVDLSSVGFETIPSITVLQTIAMYLLPGDLKRKEILGIPKADFIAAWPEVKDGVFHAVDWLRSSLNLKASRLLPYNILLVPLTYYFIKTKGAPPTEQQDAWLKQFFFWSSINLRYGFAPESKMVDDRKRMDDIVAGKQPTYPASELKVDKEDLMWERFSTSSAFSLAVLCLYAQERPQSFRNNAEIHLDNSWLKQSNSKNFHHFFPRAFLKKNDWETEDINVVLNITFVDDYLNKRVIGSKAPSVYIPAFKGENKKLKKALKSHLIDGTGIDDDDYETFLDARAEAVSKKLHRLLSGEVES